MHESMDEMKTRLIWFSIGFVLGFIFLMTFPYWAWGEGNITIEPQRDFLQGYGGIFTFDGDVHLIRKWYLDPYAQLSTVQRYRDANGSLDLEYRWTSRISTSFGGGYDSYHYFGDDRIPSEDAHVKVKYKLWN